VLHPRLATQRLAQLLRQFPAVSILGARQVGKSTLARLSLPHFTYLDLENPQDMAVVERDIAFVLSQYPRLVLDEAQRMPALFPALRSHLDRNPRHRVVVLGSASPKLMSHVSEALTGRVGLLEMDGLSIFEHEQSALWLEGGFPRLHWSRPRARPADWYASYLRTTLEQDIPQLGFQLPSQRLRNLLTMVAHGQGNVCNLSELGASLGVNYHSVAHALDVFEGVFLVRRLQPYFANVGKRLVKSPKLYVRDTGLLHSLLGMGFTRRTVLAHPKAGASFETFCIEQIALHARLADSDSSVFFYRTHAGAEIDLVLRLRGKLVPIEVKLGITPPDTRSLEQSMRDLGMHRGYVVSAGDRSMALTPRIRMLGLSDLLSELGLAPRKRKTARARR
jgi:predicted AAA+ superfamily ATPase